MAITNAQQYKQLVNPPMKGKKRPGYRGEGGYQGGATNQGGAGPRGDVDDRGSREQNRNQRAQIRAAQVRAVENLINRPTFGFTDAAKFNLSPMPIRISQGLGNLFSNAPDFVQPKDFGPANQKLLYRQMMAQGPQNMDTMPTEEDDEEEKLKDLRALAFRAEGGSMNDQIRQAYGIGDIVKKATSAVKKVAKSPIGKAAIIGAGIYGLGGGFGLKPGGFSFGNLPGASFFGKGSFNPLKAITTVTGQRGPISMTNLSGLGKLISNIPGGGITAAITAASLLPLLGLGTGEESEKEAQEILKTQNIDIDAIRESYLGEDQYRALAFKAEGGSIDEPVAKKTMPLLDMGGQEMDLRAEGGFVPIGRMEKADDVPARLSKNEFVFTAEAVRNAGEGDVDKGAEVMYNMMKNLEAGGDVSEESQGLEGARRMFQTSQRLEEVL